MSIQGEINRINNNVSATYSAIESKNGTLPEVRNSDNLALAVESIPQNTFIAGDGITIENETISVALPSKALTIAEYNALSEEQKQSETVYIITDDNS